MLINQFEIWIANLNPANGTEPGKIRPVIILQSNLLNKALHPSTIVCPLTTKLNKSSTLLRINVQKGIGNVMDECDIMIDQLRSIDNNRFMKKVGMLPIHICEKLKENIKYIMDLD